MSRAIERTVVTLKFLVAGAAAAAVVGGAAAGLSALPAPAGAPQVTPVVFGAPLPLDPAADVPSADQLTGVLNGLADPSVPFASKATTEWYCGPTAGRGPCCQTTSCISISPY